MRAIKVKDFLNMLSDNQTVVVVDTVLKKQSLPTKAMYASKLAPEGSYVEKVGKENIANYDCLVIYFGY